MNKRTLIIIMVLHDVKKEFENQKFDFGERSLFRVHNEFRQVYEQHFPKC